MTGRFPRASTFADATGVRRRRGHPPDPARPPSSSHARFLVPRMSRPRSSLGIARASRLECRGSLAPKLRERNGAPISSVDIPRQDYVAKESPNSRAKFFFETAQNDGL